jgi:hypothetical protein
MFGDVAPAGIAATKINKMTKTSVGNQSFIVELLAEHW